MAYTLKQPPLDAATISISKLERTVKDEWKPLDLPPLPNELRGARSYSIDKDFLDMHARTSWFIDIAHRRVLRHNTSYTAGMGDGRNVWEAAKIGAEQLRACIVPATKTAARDTVAMWQSDMARSSESYLRHYRVSDDELPKSVLTAARTARKGGSQVHVLSLNYYGNDTHLVVRRTKSQNEASVFVAGIKVATGASPSHDSFEFAFKQL